VTSLTKKRFPRGRRPKPQAILFLCGPDPVVRCRHHCDDIGGTATKRLVPILQTIRGFAPEDEMVAFRDHLFGSFRITNDRRNSQSFQRNSGNAEAGLP
jgi:hypothetical protein